VPSDEKAADTIIVLVGMQGGKLTAGWNLIAPGCEFAISLGSTR